MRWSSACELNCPVVKGNTDDWFLVPQTYDPNSEMERRLIAMQEWGMQQLSPADIEYMRTFRPTLEIALDGGHSLVCFHGSPHSYSDLLLATTPDAELARKLKGDHATIMAGGHTHRQMLRRFQDMIVINPGSVGMAAEEVSGRERPKNVPQAEYAIVEAAPGKASIEFRRISFDFATLEQSVHKSGMPQADWWLGNWKRTGA